MTVIRDVTCTQNVTDNNQYSTVDRCHISIVPTLSEKSWIFFLKMSVPGKSWEINLVLESPGN